MSAQTRRPLDCRRRQDELAGWPIGIVSYQLGERYVCEVDNVSPGARLARAEGRIQEEAEKNALAKAEALLSRTRTLPVE